MHKSLFVNGEWTMVNVYLQLIILYRKSPQE